jgi:hypothetical protein
VLSAEAVSVPATTATKELAAVKVVGAVLLSRTPMEGTPLEPCTTATGIMISRDESAKRTRIVPELIFFIYTDCVYNCVFAKSRPPTVYKQSG